MSGYKGRLVSIVALIVASLLYGAGSLELAEFSVTMKTENIKCPQDRSGRLETPAVETFVFQGDGGKDEPCIMAKMGVQTIVHFLNKDDEEFTTFINIPANALVSGSCKSPQWMALTWKGRNGNSRNLTIKANPNTMQFHEDGIDKYSVGVVSLEMEIDEEVFPGIMHGGETLTATVEYQRLFETPISTAFNCREVIVDLKPNVPVGPISVVFKDMQFQLYTNKSTFDEGVTCKTSESTDYVAIGIGCFLGVTIISALGSYAFCQWWRNKDRGSKNSELM